MKKLNFWLLASLLAGTVLTTACSSSDAPDPILPPNPSDNGISDGTAVKPGSMKMSALSGFVYSPTGNPLQTYE